jgi:hypothetical protein
MVKGGGRVRTISFPFKGEATGGTLIIGNTLTRNSYYLSIDTFSGQSSESVISQLAWEIAYTETLFEKSEHMSYEDVHNQLISNGMLELPGSIGTYYIAGTEKGLGIPSAPKSLTANYVKETDEIIVRWENSLSGYDNLVLLSKWDDYDSGDTVYIPGNLNEHRLKRSNIPYNINDLDIWVIGIKNGLPSSPGVITLCDHGTTIIELCGIPFTNGLAPNWETWNSPDISEISFNEVIRCENMVWTHNKPYRPIEHHLQKPYEQRIKLPSSGGTIGIYRKFLGLKSNHIYKVSLSINTNEMEDIRNKDWTLTVHATHNDSLKKRLNENQFLGKEKLPNGATGKNAGKILEFHSNNTTQGKYVDQGGQIILPEGADSIIVWLRFSGNTSGEVSIDYIKLEDLGISNKKG